MDPSYLWMIGGVLVTLIILKLVFFPQTTLSNCPFCTLTRKQSGGACNCYRPNGLECPYGRQCPFAKFMGCPYGQQCPHRGRCPYRESKRCPYGIHRGWRRLRTPIGVFSS